MKAHNKIVEIENKPENIDLLKAQAAVYKETEKLSNIDFLLCAGTTALLILLRIIFSQITIWSIVTAIVAAIVTVSSLIISFVNSNRKDLAARMQMLFDCNVLDVNWKEDVFGHKPNQEEIERYQVIQTRKDESTFQTWYNGRVSEKPLDVARVLAYQENISYDVNLRRGFIAINSILFLLLVVLTVYLIAIGSDFWLPLIPLLAWMLKITIANVWSLLKYKAVIEEFDGILDLLAGHKYVGINRFYTLFHCIYEHRRRSFKIPDRVFHALKRLLHIKADYDQLLIMEKIGRI